MMQKDGRDQSSVKEEGSDRDGEEVVWCGGVEQWVDGNESEKVGRSQIKK